MEWIVVLSIVGLIGLFAETREARKRLQQLRQQLLQLNSRLAKLEQCDCEKDILQSDTVLGADKANFASQPEPLPAEQATRNQALPHTESLLSQRPKVDKPEPTENAQTTYQTHPQATTQTQQEKLKIDGWACPNNNRSRQLPMPTSSQGGRSDSIQYHRSEQRSPVPQRSKPVITPYIEKATAMAKTWLSTGNIPVKIGMLVLIAAVIAFLRYATNQGWCDYP